MNNEIGANLTRITEQLEQLDHDLQALFTEVQSRVSGLTEDMAEDLLDRLDEMMDLLYLLDEHLCEISAKVEPVP